MNDKIQGHNQAVATTAPRRRNGEDPESRRSKRTRRADVEAARDLAALEWIGRFAIDGMELHALSCRRSC